MPRQRIPDEDQIELFRMKAGGMPVSSIATKLGISERTVATYLSDDTLAAKAQLAMAEAIPADELKGLVELPEHTQEMLSEHFKQASAISDINRLVMAGCQHRREMVAKLMPTEEMLREAIDSPYVSKDGDWCEPTAIQKAERALKFSIALTEIDALALKQVAMHTQIAALSVNMQRVAAGVDQVQTIGKALQVVMAAGYGVTR